MLPTESQSVKKTVIDSQITNIEMKTYGHLFSSFDGYIIFTSLLLICDLYHSHKKKVLFSECEKEHMPKHYSEFLQPRKETSKLLKKKLGIGLAVFHATPIKYWSCRFYQWTNFAKLFVQLPTPFRPILKVIHTSITQQKKRTLQKLIYNLVE